MKKNKPILHFTLGIAAIITLLAIGPFLQQQLLPSAFRQTIQEKEIDVSSLFYTESENAGKAAFEMQKRKKAAISR